MTLPDDPARRIVVTGLGCVSPLGADLDSSWAAATAGQSGVVPMSQLDASDYPVGFAAEVKTPLQLGMVDTWKRFSVSQVDKQTNSPTAVARRSRERSQQPP